MKIILTTAAIVFSLLLNAQNAKLIKLDELSSLINEKSDKVKIINFWASWCGPCIKEMPHFDEIGQSNNKVELYFVSLDFPSQLEKANLMLNKKGIQSTAYLLDEKDADKYISAINNDWSGAIPATLFINKEGKKAFYEHAIEKNELEKIIENFL